MKLLTMMEFRRQPGERIIDVIRNRAKFLITKQGKPVAILGPPDEGDTTIIHSDGSISGEVPLTYKEKDLGSFY
jgi:hypothetical protein